MHIRIHISYSFISFICFFLYCISFEIHPKNTSKLTPKWTPKWTQNGHQNGLQNALQKTSKMARLREGPGGHFPYKTNGKPPPEPVRQEGRKARNKRAFYIRKVIRFQCGQARLACFTFPFIWLFLSYPYESHGLAHHVSEWMFEDRPAYCYYYYDNHEYDREPVY